METSFSLSVVIPAYNEEASLATAVTSVHSALAKTTWDWEIIIVNDGSRDHTGQIAKKLAKKYPHITVVENKPNRGYGGALKAGFLAASKDFIVLAHADNQFDFSQITKLVDLQVTTQSDIVSGIRPGGGADPAHRKLNRWLWNTLVRALFGYLATDIDCGFKLIRRDILSRLSLPSNGAMIDTELYAGARARGIKIAETPVIHLPRTAGHSTGANFRVILKALKELIFFWLQLRNEIMVEQGKAIFKWEALAILLILGLASYLRLSHIDQYMTFLGDEGRDVTIARDIILGRNFPLIGPGTSVGNMYLGPLYYYFMAPPLWLANFSPVGPAIQIAIVGVLTTALLWWVGRQWFNRLPALVTVLLYAIAPTVIIYSHSSWNPNIMPFFALLTMYGIWKVWRFGYFRWLVISAVSFAFVLQSHYLGLLLLPTMLLFTALGIYKHQTTFSIRYMLLAISIFLALMSPLLIFDLSPAHPWLNTTNMVKFFTNRETTVNLKPYKSLPLLFPLMQQVTGSLLTAKQTPADLWLTIILLAVLLPALVIKRDPNLGFTLVWLLFGIVGLGLYKQHIYDHYFGFLFPVLFLCLGFTIYYLTRQIFVRVAALVLVTYLLWLNWTNNPLKYPANFQLNHTQQIADLITTESRQLPFNLALLSSHNYDASYRYFLALANSPYHTINDQHTDQLFVICEDPVCEPIGNRAWEVAAFGWAKIDKLWEFPWGAKVYRLIPNPTGKPV